MCVNRFQICAVKALTPCAGNRPRGSEVVSFGEDEQCTLYWHPTTATSSSGHPDEAERQAELATLRSRLQELDAQIAQHAPKETYLYPTTFRAHDTTRTRHAHDTHTGGRPVIVMIGN
jgi:hypothetical protein